MKTSHEITAELKQKLKPTITKMELSKRLGVSRPTLDAKIKQSNWSASDLRTMRELGLF